MIMVEYSLELVSGLPGVEQGNPSSHHTVKSLPAPHSSCLAPKAFQGEQKKPSSP